MSDLHLFTKRLESNVTILTQARNLTGYALAMTTAGETQGAITQINQRLQTVIGGLLQVIEEIRASGPEAEQVDTTVLLQFLTTSERADLEQLEHSYNELSVTRRLIHRFRQRIIDLGLKRKTAKGERWLDYE